MFKKIVLLILASHLPCQSHSPEPAQDKLSVKEMPPSFVYLRDVDASIVQEMRYFGPHNFIGRVIPGYLAGECLLTKEAANALHAVQTELRQYDLSLKVYDCYRPQQAVNSFMDWSKDTHDQKMKAEFYPRLDKANTFKEGYISEKSGHSRGSTMDLTVIELPVKAQATYKDKDRLVSCLEAKGKRFNDNSLDFGTGYDCFDPKSNTAHPGLLAEQKRNRLLLTSIMGKFGFKNYDKEWWHFTLINEPFPDTFFDFPIKSKP